MSGDRKWTEALCGDVPVTDCPPTKSSRSARNISVLVRSSGVPAVVDFAAMRDAVKKLGGDPEKINPVCPADLVIDHSIQVDFNRK